jgi:hypothetical protein
VTKFAPEAPALMGCDEPSGITEHERTASGSLRDSTSRPTQRPRVEVIRETSPILLDRQPKRNIRADHRQYRRQRGDASYRGRSPRRRV